MSKIINESTASMVNETAIKVMKEQVFNNMFIQKTTNYKKPKNGQYVDTYIYPINHGQAQFFNALYKKYKGINPYSYADFMNECASLTFKAISRFQIIENGDWNGILRGTDKANIGRLMTSIKRTVQNDIIKFVNVDSKFTKINSKDVIVTINTDSLNDQIETDDNVSIQRNEMVSESYWFMNDDYRKNHFIEWFRENRESILTKSQIMFLDGLERCRNDSEYTENDVEAVTGVPSFKVNTKLARIEERALKAWEKAYPGSVKSITDVEKEGQADTLTNFLIVTDMFEYESQDVTDWISARMDDDFLTNTFYDALNVNDTKDWIQAFRNGDLIPEHVVFEMVQAAKDKAIALSEWNTEKTIFCIQRNENAFDRLRHESEDERIREFKEQPCYVYDRNGNLIRKEAYIADIKKTNIVEIEPKGIVNK